MKSFNKSVYKKFSSEPNTEIKSSKVTISAKVCNNDKFNELWQILNSTHELKNEISTYCYQNLAYLISDYKNFLTKYQKFNSNFLNSWEIQKLFQEVCIQYFQVANKYLSKNKYIVNFQNTDNKTDFYFASTQGTRLSKFAKFIDEDSHLSLCPAESSAKNHIKPYNSYLLNFNVQKQLNNLKNNLLNHKNSLDTENDLTEKSRLEKTIKKYHSLIEAYEQLSQYEIKKPLIYNRLLNLIKNKKLNALKKVKLIFYKNGVHSRHIEISQLSIIHDQNNNKYNYFLKIRRLERLTGKTPLLPPYSKNKSLEIQLNKLEEFNKNNYLFLPILFNQKYLKNIGKTIDNIFSKEHPQILLTCEQLRKNPKSRKIHIIFRYDGKNTLSDIIKKGKHKIPSDGNTLGIDINLKHNLFVDSNSIHYKEILHNKNKSQFIQNINEIVVLQNISNIERTEKQKYRLEKLLRSNESLLKTYLSGIIKKWKQKKFLHLVLEDLNLQNDKSFYVYTDKNNQEFRIKYTRLARLLRICQIKAWIKSMATKQGMFTHLVHSAYTSQECSKCHCIKSTNRKIQEIFVCQNSQCPQYNLKINADENAAKNIKNRITNINLKQKLSEDNVYLCSQPKPIYYKKIKGIIENIYSIK